MRMRVSSSVVGILVAAATGCGGGGGGDRPGAFFAVGGTITKPDAQEVVLQLNGGQDLHLTAAGPFTFSQGVMDRNSYTVLVKSAPAGQLCTITHWQGSITGAPVTDVDVTCSKEAHTVGGTVSGLTGTVVLDLNGEKLSVTQETFVFATAIALGAQYEVKVATDPAGQRCALTNGKGIMGKGDVSTVAVECWTVPAKPTLSVRADVKQLEFSWTAVSGATSYQLYEAADGATYAKAGEAVTGTSAAREVSVHRLTWPTARYRVEACNAGGCASSDAIGVAEQMIATIGFLKGSNTSAYDQFGSAVALSADGSTLAVGAPYDADDAGPGRGAVYVFTTRDGSAWSQQARLRPSDADAAQFGAAVALSADGSTLAVGAPCCDESAATAEDGNQASSSPSPLGATYVFTRDGSTWSQQSRVKSPNTYFADFGASVALSADGSTLAVRADDEAGAATGVNGNPASGSAPRSGAVYVFTRDGSTWSQQAYVKASNAEEGDEFGTSIALSADGSTLAVGAPSEDSASTGVNGNPASNSATAAGAAYVFTRNGGTWSQQAYVKTSNPAAYDCFGASIALSADGSSLAVGATGAKAVYVFTRNGSAWSQQASLKRSIAVENDFFAASLAMSADGSTLAVGAHWDSSAARGVNGGDPADRSAGFSGAVYVFTRNEGAWSQRSYVKASTAKPNSYFGSSVALSADGGRLAVGANGESSAATAANGNGADTSAFNAGAVYLY